MGDQRTLTAGTSWGSPRKDEPDLQRARLCTLRRKEFFRSELVEDSLGQGLPNRSWALSRMPAMESNRWKVNLVFGLSLAFGLSWTAGFVDAVGYMALYRVFVANMSGNSIALGLGSAKADWSLFFRRGSALPVFFLGMLLSRWAILVAKRAQISILPTVMYGLEALLLGLFVVIGRDTMLEGKVHTDSLFLYYLLVALPSIAMGMQNAVLTNFGPFDLHTTHVTGTLAKCTDECARFLMWFRDRTRGRKKSRFAKALAVSWRQITLRNAAALAGVWLCYVIGAGMGAFLKLKWELLALLFPISFLVLLVTANILRPFIRWLR